MTSDQTIHRAERVAIMVYEGKMSEEEAQRYCDGRPNIYGIREHKESQEKLL